MRTQVITAAAAVLLQLHSCAAAPTPDTHNVEGEKREVPFPTEVPSFPAGGPSGFKSIWSELTDRDAPAEKASPEGWTATTTDSAKRSMVSGINWVGCAAINRRGGPLPKRCMDYPFRIGIPVWDEDEYDGETGTTIDPVKRGLPLLTRHAASPDAAPSVDRRIAPECVINDSGECTKDTTSAWEGWPFNENIPGVAAVPRGTSEKKEKRIVLQPGMEPIDTPTQIGDLTLHIGRSDSDSDEKRYLCPIIDRRSDGTVVRSCLGEETYQGPLIPTNYERLNLTSLLGDPMDNTGVNTLTED